MNYDANGNMVTKSEGKNFWRYTWDYENRMTMASTRRETVRYRYDALGRRVQRYFRGNKENTKFIYDGLDVVADDNSGTLTKYQNGLGIDNKLKMVTGATTRYFLADHLGSTTALTDSSGNASSSASYDSFGNATGNLSTRYAYTGREFDNFTGLHFYRARWYDGKLGRFISEDPIGFEGGDSNLYGYVGNNPTNFKDALGLFPDNPYDLIPEDGWTAIAHLGNFAAGFGDHITTIPFTDFKLTQAVRKRMGSDDVIDYCSATYSGGEWAGLAWEVGFGAAKGIASLTKSAGRGEWSHWVPKRYRNGAPDSLKRFINSGVNGNYVSATNHALNDPYRYRFMKKVWKQENPINPALVRQWNRAPDWAKGGGIGGAIGASQSSSQACACER